MNKTLIRIISGILGIVMTVMLFSPSVNVYAAVTLSGQKEVTEDTEETEASAYTRIEIHTAEDMIKLAEDCRLDSYSSDKYVVLCDDIMLAGTGYEPIPVFTGIFDGCGHKIDGVIFKEGVSFGGFISRTSSDAVVKNLTVGGNISPNDKQMVLGGIVGDNYGTIQNCKYIGIVKGSDYIGGITGYNEATGIIADCTSYGVITGQHYTGGIAGANAGGIYRCGNEAKINTTNEDRAVSFEDINVDKYLSGILDIKGESKEAKEINAANSTIDCGGIAGFSSGVIEFCDNNGNIGYEHVGYNVGGIVGRQSGFVHGCTNKATVLGRKDVAGIAGQAEPYISFDLTEDIVTKLSDNINELHDLIDDTLSDSADQSDVITDRLNLVQKFTDDALSSMNYLAGQTINWANGLTGAAGDVMDRLDYAVDEAGKKDGAIEQSKNAATDVSNAASSLSDAADAANIYNYMSEEEKSRYDAAKQRIKDNSEKYNGYYKEVYSRYYYRYLDAYRRDTGRSYYDASVGLSAMDIIAYDANGDKIYDDADTNTWPNSVDYTAYSNDISYVRHGDGSDFPMAGSEGQGAYETALVADATDSAGNSATAYANTRYPTYAVDIENDAKIITQIVAAHEKEMTNDATDSTKAAMNSLSAASGELASASNSLKGIASNLSGRDDITLPSLGDEYRNKTNAFITALQGVSDNMGQLNGEMNTSSDVLTEDMKKVNDSFNTVMLLFTDALDGALDADVSDIYEDESISVAEVSKDGVIADCTNNGRIEGDIDTAGICGTMAIEYDFDLESDRTGISDSKAGSVYKTMCILRNDVNNGRIMGGKSYAGGMTGLQEMGIILGCENYGRVKSASGDYVGGIAGSSLSDIRESYSKCILSGEKYIGGIAGYAHNMSDCCSMPSISGSKEYAGAVAGEVSDEYNIHDNFFYSESLGGIDRASYEAMAKPVAYDELVAMDGVPDEFGKLVVTFLTEDEKEAGRAYVQYGGSIGYDEYPVPEVKDGCYVKWETDTVDDIRSDIEIEGKQTGYYTTIAGRELRENGQSAILADGAFRDDQTLETEFDTEYPGAYEHWKIEIPDDGADTHTIRIQVPAALKRYEIYAGDGQNFDKVSADDMGMYKLFAVKGNTVELLIVEQSIPEWIYILAAAAATVLIVIIVSVAVYRKKKKGKVNGNIQ